MSNDTPQEGQDVQVKLGTGAWQAAKYRRGQFVDVYGLPLDANKISEWQPADPITRTDRDTLSDWNAIRSFH